VQSLELLVSGVELDKFAVKATGEADELEDLADEVERLASLPPDEVQDELTETEEELPVKKDEEEQEEETGEQAEDDHEAKDDIAGEAEVAPEVPRVKTYRRKTPRQLAQEAIFDAMWAAGVRPTETRLSPELKQERERLEQEAREERRRIREQRQKEEKENRERERRQEMSEDELSSAEQIDKAMQRREERTRRRAAQDAFIMERSQAVLQEQKQDTETMAKDAQQVHAEMEECRRERDEMAQLKTLCTNADLATAEKVQDLLDFTRIGGIEAAADVVAAAVAASKELTECLEALEEQRFINPEVYCDEALLLFKECIADFFGLGFKPESGAAPLPSLVRSRVKRVRFALRDLVVTCDFIALSKGGEGRVVNRPDAAEPKDAEKAADRAVLAVSKGYKKNVQRGRAASRGKSQGRVQCGT